jgi:beta-glucosidase
VIDDPEINVDESTTVRFKVTNTGTVAGDEVVQFYIRDVVASVSQPVLALKGFQRVHLGKGETKDLSFTVTPEMLHLLNEQMEWAVEPGDFRLLIGASSYDIRLRGILQVKE